MRLPPLNALRAFEAAARHEGFIGAADELHVTRGAISRHVKQLEEHLGTQLFIRSARGVRLTDAGRRLLPVLSEAFGRIAREARRISGDTTELRVICPPATSIRWLIPRLDDFRAKHPDIGIRLTTEFYCDIGLDNGAQDIGFSVEFWPNRGRSLNVQTLFPVYLTPACAPSLLQGRTMLASADELADFPILHEVPSHADWTAWINAFKVTSMDPQIGHDFPNLDMATKAAVMGAGMVMADLVLCREELDGGALVAPLPEMVCASPTGGICLIGEEDRWEEPKVAAFRAWATEMAEQDMAALRDLTTGSGTRIKPKSAPNDTQLKDDFQPHSLARNLVL